MQSSIRRKLEPPGQAKKTLSKACVLQAVAMLHIPGEEPEESSPEEMFECELDADDSNGISGIFLPLQGEPAQMQVLQDKFRNGELISGESTLDMPVSFSENSNGIEMPPGQLVKVNTPAANQRRRKLSQTGDKPILVVKVTDVDGLARAESPAQISDDVFGTSGDPVNLKSQLYGCSMETLNVIPGDGYGKESAPGVIEVTIDISLVGNDRYAVRNAVTAAVQAKLGFGLPGPYDQVMYVLEKCYTGCGWAAFAYINSWNSVYQDRYYKLTGVQVSEQFLG